MIQLSNTALFAEISPAGGSVTRFSRIDGTGEFPLFYRDGQTSGLPLCFPLVPFGNRLGDNRFEFAGVEHQLPANTADPLYIHGDGWLASWDVLSAEDTSCVLRYTHGAEGPYRYVAEQHFLLRDNAFSISLSVTNTGDAPLPFGIGLHPYFPLTAQTTLRFSARRFWNQDASFLPSTSEPVSGEMDFSIGRSPSGRWRNTEYEGWDGRAEISWPECGTMLTIDADQIFSRCMLFVSSTDFDPEYREDYFCFEPMSHGVDGHHRPRHAGLTILEPTATLAGSCRFHVFRS